ncbi:MAG: DEAD/DEAH box helicase [Candidatus Helarchaeota archaeon]
MSYWRINSNQLSHNIQLNPIFKALFNDYLHHRFRVLYSQTDKFIVPFDWEFDGKTLILEFENETIFSLAKKAESSFKFRKYHRWKSAELIPLVSSVMECLRQQIYGFNQFYPVNGKWIPPISFFISNCGNNKNSIQAFEMDIEHVQKWIKLNVRRFQNILDVDEIRYYENLFKYLSNHMWDELHQILKRESVFELSSFLDILTEAENFIKIREIYRYHKLERETALKYKNLGDNEFVLELNVHWKDYPFDKFNRPSPQELWDKLMENSRTSRILAISNQSYPPDPLVKLSDISETAEWFGVHADQPLIYVRKRGKPIAKSGFLYVYEYGDIDQIQKKRYFIKFAKNHYFLKKFLTKSTSAINPNRIIRNRWNRKELVDVIIKNRGLFAVQGPPGTGKTYLATEVVTKLIQNNPFVKILVCSKEHLSLNHILETITHRLKDLGIKFRAYRSMSMYRSRKMKDNDKLGEYLKSSIMKEIGSYSWNEDSKIWYQAQENLYQEFDLRNRSLSEEAASIYFCTTMDSSFYGIINAKSFDLVVIEEAGKCYPSELLHVLCVGPNILMIGDQNQLPPFQIKETQEALRIWEKTIDRALYDSKLDKNLFRRFNQNYGKLRKCYLQNKSLEEQQLNWLKPFETLFNLLPSEKTHILNEQFRLEEPLSKVIGRVFYRRVFEYKKELYKPLEGIIPPEYDTPLLWIDTPHMTKVIEATEDPEKNGSRINQYELNVIIKYLSRLNSSDPIDLAILTPYNDQKYFFLDSKELKAQCAKITTKSFAEIINTNDEYQGREADLTIISLVRNNVLGASSSWGFITEPERLNVMFSRSKSRQVIVGCSEHIKRNREEVVVKILYELFTEYKKEGKIISAEVFLKNAEEEYPK